MVPILFRQAAPKRLRPRRAPYVSPGEVGIARLELKSTTSDVISIRAAPDPGGIRYRIVDEYETEFQQPFETSQRPLTLMELIEFITGVRHPELDGNLALVYNNMNAQNSDRVRLRHFTTVASAFYPQLYEHFEHVFDDWVRELEEEK